MRKIVIIFCIIFSFLATFIVPATVVPEAFATESQNRRWQFPKKIKTYIPPNHKRTQMMKNAFAEWSRKTNNKIVFRYVTSKATADIVVEFVNIVPNAEREIGLTRSRFISGNRLIHSTIYIAEKTSTGVQLGRDAVYTVMLHEIGHAIGLGGHSDDPMSIMYPTEDDRQEISKGDLKWLDEVYGW